MEKYEYDSSRRLKYYPEFHFNHKKEMSEEEKAYMCRFWEVDGSKMMEMALGKTESSLSGRVEHLKKTDQFNYYYYLWNQLSEKEWMKDDAL